ncbi:MAG: NUDIX hydrolase [Candidatus Zixiibacteriota bacterium]
MANHLYAQIVQIAVLINDANQALILRTPEGKWQLPGGRLNEGEPWDAGLRREIREETGIIDVEILSILMTDNWEFHGAPMYGVYFLCRAKTKDVRISDEHTDHRWVGKNDNLEAIEFWHENLRLMVDRGLAMARGPEI